MILNVYTELYESIVKADIANKLILYLRKAVEEEDKLACKECLLKLLPIIDEGVRRGKLRTLTPKLFINSFYDLCKRCVAGVYFGVQFPWEDVRNLLDFLSRNKEICKKEVFARHLSFLEGRLLQWFNFIDPIIHSYHRDLIIVAVMCGAAEPAFLLSYKFNGKFLPLRFSKYKWKDKEVRRYPWQTNDYLLNLLKGRNVCIVEDYRKSGESLSEVSKYVENFKPSTILETAVIDRSFKNKDFYLNVKFLE